MATGVSLGQQEAAPLRGRLLYATASVAIILLLWIPVLTFPAMQVGGDYQTYMTHTSRWLAGGPLYPAYQLEGPYLSAYTESMFPPVALWLFVPFALMPPALSVVLWWTVPAVAVIWMLRRLRPVPWSWPIMALCLSFPVVVAKIAVGSPTIWCLAALSVGVVYAGPAVFVLLKPSFLPFALWGAWRRQWWLWAAVFAAMCLPFGAMWLDWLTVIRNATNASPLYSAGEAPLLLLPLVAWLLRDRRPEGQDERPRLLTIRLGDRHEK